MGFGRRAKRPGRDSGRASGTGDRWLSRQVRGLRPDRNPLRRRIDRAEIYLLGGLFAASAAAVPFAAHAAGHAAYESALRMQQEQLATRSEVTAVVTATSSADVDGYTVSGYVEATATWKSATGVHESAVILTEPGSHKGTRVSVWIDPAGDLTTPPIATAQVISERDAATMGGIAGVIVMAVGAGGLIHFVLFRRRLAAWDADWRVTARAWNRQSW